MSKASEFAEKFKNSIEVSKVIEAHGKIKDSLRKDAGKVASVYNNLDIQKHGLVCLLFLGDMVRGAARHKKGNEFAMGVCARVITFLKECNPLLVEAALIRWIVLVKDFANVLQTQYEVPTLGLKAIKIAMDKAQSRPDEMTGIERDFLKIGILSKCYSYCKRVIEERNLCYFEKKRTAIEPLDIMVFNYYKGFLYCALKEFPKAVKAFQLVLAQPTNIFHHCLIQAYKKLVLSSLLMEKQVDLPKCQSSMIKMLLPSAAEAYSQLQKFYFKKDTGILKEFLEKNIQTYVDDRNLGLIQQLYINQLKAQIRNLKDTYLTLSLVDISTRLQLDIIIISDLIRGMIKDGELLALIDEKNEMIIFYEEEEDYGQIVEELNHQTDTIITLMDKLKTLNYDIKKTPTYQKKQVLKSESHNDEMMMEAYND